MEKAKDNYNCRTQAVLLPLQEAGGMPMQMKYWNVIMHARKQQYFGQISAIAFLLRRYNTRINERP